MGIGGVSTSAVETLIARARGERFRLQRQEFGRLQGQNASRSLAFEDPSALRRYALGSDGYDPSGPRPTMSGAFASTPALQLKEITGEQINAALATLASEREAMLSNWRTLPPRPRVVGEDALSRASHFVMAGDEHVDLRLTAQAHAIGLEQGIGLIHISKGTGLRREGLERLRAPAANPWTQDQAASAVDGSLSIPPSVGGEAFIRDALEAGRSARLKDMAPMIQHQQGAVERDQSRRQMAALALAQGVPLRMKLAYLEEGNVLDGVLPSGEGYALVGRDSVSVAKAQLERDLGRLNGQEVVLSDAEVLEIIAWDRGLPADRLFPVEQPARFHLDMAMSLGSPGEVILHDSRKAAELQAKWLDDDYLAAKPQLAPDANENERAQYEKALRDWQELAPRIETRRTNLLKSVEGSARVEALTLKDLQAPNLFTVRRPALLFEGGAESMNFANAVPKTNAEGDTFQIFLGGDPRAEQHVLSELREMGMDINTVYFLDAAQTQKTLSLHGGINCRIRPLWEAREE